jgi:hypothetical protein
MKYKLHHVEQITSRTYRMVVPGGWVYEIFGSGGRAAVFVPDPNVEIEE